jgi:hypothetical protein
LPGVFDRTSQWALEMLSLIERSPDCEFGAPGPLVHEIAAIPGYEQPRSFATRTYASGLFSLFCQKAKPFLVRVSVLSKCSQSTSVQWWPLLKSSYRSAVSGRDWKRIVNQ